MTKTVRFHRPTDEQLIIYLDDLEIGYYNHDVDGWEGITAAETLTKNIADIMSWKIISTE